MIIQHYLNLIKPGIVIGNVTSSIGGFLIASENQHINYTKFACMIIGLTLIIASSCIINNIIDRDIDAIMIRTKNRVLAQKGLISVKISTYYAIILNILGFLLLGLTYNILTILLTIIGFVIYIGIYSLWMKRRSIHSIIVGSISGAMPPLIGYCTVSHQLDLGALILLIMFSLWQIPHSYSITIFQSHDYQLAAIPTFNTFKGIKTTQIHMLIYILGFFLSVGMLTMLGYVSSIFLSIISILNIFWLYTGWYKYKSINDHCIWAKKMFILSIIIIISVNTLLSLDSLLFSNYKNNMFTIIFKPPY